MLSLRNKQVIIAVAFPLAFMLLVAGELHFANKMAKLQMDIARLREEQTLYRLQISRIASEVEAYKDALSELSKYPIKLSKDGASFYSNVESALVRNNMSVTDIRPAGAGEGIVAVRVEFTGNYSSVLGAIKEWRQIKEVARLKSMTILPDKEGTVRGVAILESPLRR